MRRWVCLFLLLVLPLQWSWAAQAGVGSARCACGAAMGDGSADPGDRQAAPAPAGKTCCDAVPDGCGGDCPLCHAHAAGTAPAPMALPAGDPPAAGRTDYRRHVTEPLPDRLLRPPMPALA